VFNDDTAYITQLKQQKGAITQEHVDIM